MLFAAMLLIATSSLRADPRTDYLLHCSGCHLPDGTGHSPQVPTLHDVIGRLVAEPAGRSYIVRVPGASQVPIDDKRLTELVNWILTEFNSDTLPENFRLLTEREVKRARDEVLADPARYRAENFPDY